MHTHAHIYIRTAEQEVPGLVTPMPASIGFPVLEGMDATGPISEDEDGPDCLVGDVIDRLSSFAHQAGLPHDTNTLSSFVSSGSIGLQHSDSLRIHDSHCSWRQYYPVLSFLISGHLHVDYERISGLLGLPNCSSTQWGRIMHKLEEHVTELAKWSCSQVQQEIIKRGDAKRWIASFDGFYLTRCHYSNNSFATLHDYSTGKIAYFTHQTKRGPGHTWTGTSGGAEADMLDKLLGKVRQDNFVLQEMIADKDSSENATFCCHFPEGTITYCSNHCAKTLHKHLEKIKRNKCEVSIYLKIFEHLLLK